MLRTAAERQQDAERQRRRPCRHRRRPASRAGRPRGASSTSRRPNIPPTSRMKARIGKIDEQEQRVQPLARDRGDCERDQSARQQQKDEVDAPALAERIAAVDELGELRLHECPAGSRFRADAGLPVRSRPDRTQESPVEKRRHREENDDRGENGQDRIADAGEQIVAQPCRPGRRSSAAAAPRAAICWRTNERSVCAWMSDTRYLSTSAMRRLNQFMKSGGERLIER